MQALASASSSSSPSGTRQAIRPVLATTSTPQSEQVLIMASGPLRPSVM